MNLSSFTKSLMKFTENIMGGADIAVDLGTSLTRIAIPEKGIVLREPTYIGINTKTSEYIFFGQEAKEIYGKAPQFVDIIKPVEHSIISDFDSGAALMLRYFRASVYPYFFKSKLLKTKLTAYAAISSSATEVEQRATEELLNKAGAQTVFLIEKTVAASLGAGLSVFANKPVFIIDMGAGLIEMAIIIMGGIVVTKSMKLGGDHMDRLIANYLHLKYGIITGVSTCEKLKNTTYSLASDKSVMTVRGKSLENGLPKSVRVNSQDLKEALASNLNQIIDGIKELLEMVPPETIDGIIKDGIVLTGQLASIGGIDKFIMQDVKIPVAVAENPQDATIQGILKLISNKEKAKKIMIKQT